MLRTLGGITHLSFYWLQCFLTDWQLIKVKKKTQTFTVKLYLLTSTQFKLERNADQIGACCNAVIFGILTNLWIIFELRRSWSSCLKICVQAVWRHVWMYLKGIVIWSIIFRIKNCLKFGYLTGNQFGKTACNSSICCFKTWKFLLKWWIKCLDKQLCHVDIILGWKKIVLKWGITWPTCCLKKFEDKCKEVSAKRQVLRVGRCHF